MNRTLFYGGRCKLKILDYRIARHLKRKRRLLHSPPQSPFFKNRRPLHGQIQQDHIVDFGAARIRGQSRQPPLIPQLIQLLPAHGLPVGFWQILKIPLREFAPVILVFGDQYPLFGMHHFAQNDLFPLAETALARMDLFFTHQPPAGFGVERNFYEQTRGVAQHLSGTLFLIARIDGDFDPI